MIGETLQNIVQQVRVEVNDVLDPAQNVDSQRRYELLVDRRQQEIGQKYDWPQLRERAVIDVAAGRRFIQLPSPLTNQRLRRIEVFWSGKWLPLPIQQGITSVEFEIQDSELDERRDPIERWDFKGTAELEVWPIPQSPQRLRVTGSRDPNKLTSPSSRAEIDDTAIILLTAAHLLQATDPARAAGLRRDADRHIAQVLNSTAPRRTIDLKNPGISNYRPQHPFLRVPRNA